jgi:hypothetical protein
LKKTILIASILLIVFVLLTGMVAADRLPNQTPENQVFSMVSSVEAIGMYSGSQSLQWTAGYAPISGSAMNVYALGGEGACARMNDEEYEQFHSRLVAAGGSDTGTPGEGYTVCSMNMPATLYNVNAYGDERQGYTTFGEIGEGITGDGPTQTLQISTGHGGLHTGILDPDEVRATTAYSEMSETNGGYVSETKTFDPDTRNKALDLYNVEATKTFTYATDANTGSVAQTSEMIALDLMGSPTLTADVIACPFGPSVSEFYPAFCNVVYAKSMSQGVTSAAQSSSAQVRMIAATADVGSALNYNFDVKPDASAGVGYAMGTFGTEFGVSIKEARGNNLTPSQTVVYTDKATVAGMVAKFTKQHSYKGFFG